MTRLLCFVAVLAVIFSGACSQQPPQPTPAEKPMSNEEWRALISKPKEEKVQLLALKYKLPREKIDAVVHTYLANHDLMCMIAFSDSASASTNAAKSPSIPETIARLEKEQGIPSDILASMIIDYQVWDYVDWARSKSNE